MASTMTVVPLQQGVHGPRTGACHGPTEAKRGAAQVGGFVMRRFALEFNHIALETPNAEPSDDPHTRRSNSHGAADDAIHVDALKGKHLLDAKPGEHFGFDENQAKHRAQNQCNEMFHGEAFKKEWRGGRTSS